MRSEIVTAENEVVKDEFDFSSLEIQEVPVRGPDGKDYVLREANGGAAKKYNDARTGGIKFKDGSAESVSGMGGLEPLLVSLCLYRTNDDDGNILPKAIPMATKLPYIEREFPYQVIKVLHDKAREISNLSEGNPYGDSLKKALELGGAPTTYEDLKTFVDGLPDSKEYRALRLIFEEDEAKN